MNLQPLYDVKERLEYAAIAGVSLLGEDFRLQRAAEALKPLAAASPVFGKIDAGLSKLLAAPQEQRAGLLLDVLALVDAVAYTQAKTGAEGDLEPLPIGGGVYHQISYGQISPLMTALTTTGGGRMEIVKSAWENHPEFFEDYRVLPAVIGGLGDSYGEMSELCATLLKKLGPSVIPALKQGFDPAGKKEMVRRVEVIAALEKENAAPWLREILPEAKRDVRTAVITALGNGDNAALLLDLTKSERGNNREAALQSLARLDGPEVQAFWEQELAKHSESVKALVVSQTDWAIDLVTTGLRQRLEEVIAAKEPPAKGKCDDIVHWCGAIGHKDSPVMMDFWRWADAHMEDIDKIKTNQNKPVFLGVRLTDILADIMRHAGPGPLRDYCLTLFDNHPAMTRYLEISFHAALLSLPAAEVYEKYSPYIVTIKPLLDTERKKTLNHVLLRSFNYVIRDPEHGGHALAGSQPTAQPLDIRWINRMTHAIWKDVPLLNGWADQIQTIYWENADKFDAQMMRLADPADEETRKALIPYYRKRLKETHKPYTYSCWLFRLGSSPNGILGDAMAKNPTANRTGTVWKLMNEAAQALPAEEVVALLKEILDSKCIYQGSQPRVEKAISWTIEQLLAGKPFPPMEEWTRM